MNILADHCLPGKTIKLLRTRGHKVITLRELNKTTAPDQEVLQIAKKHRAVLITTDLDFGNILIYPPKYYQGIIVLRMKDRTADTINLLLDKYLSSPAAKSLSKKLTIIDSGGVRIRL